MIDSDRSAELQAAVQEAAAHKTSLQIVAGGSKKFYGRAATGMPLSVAQHRGILHHEPTELIITARAGTPLAEIEAALAAHGQMLPFEPPHFGPTATLGGTIACGLSGPRRPYTGAARDFVLGVKIINGQGETLKFGGEVMKNVAGFDISRLMAGALGTLGIILEASLKVLPRPRFEQTRSFEYTPAEALDKMNRWAALPLPLSGAAYDGTRIHLRLSGSEIGVQHAAAQLGGESLVNGERFWHDLREQQLPFFQGGEPLWRLSLPPATPPLTLPGHCFIDWSGAQRWLHSDLSPVEIWHAAAQLGGHATLFRKDSEHVANRVFQPLSPGLAAIHQRLKAAFDPLGIVNPGRLYADF